MKKFTAFWLAALLISVLVQPAAADSNAHRFWTISSGQWQIIDGQLSTEAVGEESWIWAGDSPITTQGDLQADLTMEFANVPGDNDGRHGGMMFYASVATNRGDPTMNGYTIDWIDRADDHGFRLIRWDDGNVVPLAIGTPDLADPPLFWELQVQGEVIRFFADEHLIFEVVDGTYRDGHFGLWAFGNGTHILVDDVHVGNAFHDSFSGPLTAPQE